MPLGCVQFLRGDNETLLTVSSTRYNILCNSVYSQLVLLA